MGGLRVVVADDDLVVRAGIEALLANEADMSIVESCATLPELFDAVNRHEPDVVLTDVRMPPQFTDEGIRAAIGLRASHPNVGVVVLSQYADATYALDLIRDGSQGRSYLLKERIATRGQLAEAVRIVASGGSFIDQTVVERLVNSQVRRPASPVQRLTAREREVLGHIAGGCSNAAIARRLIISDRAVEKHVNSIFSKLDLTNGSDVHRRVAAVLLHLANSQPS
jgi:DNA-binding NarL/FixJ family response regulator